MYQELKKRRLDKGYSIEKMAFLLGYKSKVTYHNIETGKVKISLDLAAKMSKILNVTIADLFPDFFTFKVQDLETNKKYLYSKKTS